ncbi:MAG: cob(I)yrinic acid a,c-diamide adenosyltransferase [Puniceicoccaceae bacterium]
MTAEQADGYFQIYTGDGKGKTTASLGLALRAAGRGYPVYIGQFMKGQDYGELHSLPLLETVTHEQYGDPGWVYKGKVTEAQRAAAHEGLLKAKKALVSGKYRIVILDEINMALWFELITLEEVLELVDQRPAQVELVFTGRKAHEEVIAKAHLVTEMREVKHYFSQGVPARKGIEN